MNPTPASHPQALSVDSSPNDTSRQIVCTADSTYEKSVKDRNAPSITKAPMGGSSLRFIDEIQQQTQGS
jgi:hypothetical protein